MPLTQDQTNNMKSMGFTPQQITLAGTMQPADPWASQAPSLSSYGANPYSGGLSSFVSNLKSPATVAYTGGSYQAKDMSQAPLPQYDAMRTRLNSQYSQNQSQGQDAIDRQFAAAGGGPGNGAQLKQTENLTANTEAQKSQDLMGINAEEAQARTGLQQQEQQKEFQSGEAARGYGFQAQGLNAQLGLQGDQLRLEGESSLAGLNTSYDQAQEQAQNDEFNKILAQYQAKHSGGLFGGGGFLGLGL